MNYPIVAKKVFRRLKFSTQDVWQNLRELKRNISSLVRNIDHVGDCVMRNRQLLRGLPASKVNGDEPLMGRREPWTSCPMGDQL
jgi:hypothetical protein